MIVLDTHIWLWWLNGNKAELGEDREIQILEADSVGVSAISCFEVAWLYHHNRIQFCGPLGEWFDKALIGSSVNLLPITPEVASMAVQLPEHHKDPQDRIIIATALVHDAKVMSVDSKFVLYNELAGRIL